MENQQHNNYSDNILSEEFIQSAKKQPTKIHVVFVKLQNNKEIERTDSSFEDEQVALDFSEQLAIDMSGFNLSYWEYSKRDICEYYTIEEVEGFDVVYRILIYPR